MPGAQWALAAQAGLLVVQTEAAHPVAAKCRNPRGTPCPSYGKGDLRRQYEQCADKDAGAKHERGNGIYPTEPHGTSLQWFANPSQCFERCRHRCGSGSGCMMVAAMQQPMAMTSAIAIRETHISPLLSSASTIEARIPTQEYVGWFRTRWVGV